MRALWSGAISFGLVNIPVKLYSGVGGDPIDFDLLRKTDLSPIRYARIAVEDGKEVEYKNIVKGYAYEKGKYVVLTDKDFEKLNSERTKTIEILDFVKEEEVDSIYYEKPYYLEPEKGSEKAYVLLANALKESKKLGLAKYVLRNREHLGALKNRDGLIVLNQMRFEQDIRPTSALNIPPINPSKKENEMALELINQLTRPFIPATYKDTYVAELKKIIEAKARGKVLKVAASKKSQAKVKDLMTVLKESIKAGKKNAA